MVDNLEKGVRSRVMSAIKSRDTRPEVLIRRALHREGFRYRLHVKELPGKPDLVFPRYNAVIQVNGCFWHSHGCYLSSIPRTRVSFWAQKLDRNRERDALNLLRLNELGWRVLTIWECALQGKQKRDINTLLTVISDWLKEGSGNIDISGKGFDECAET